MQVRRMCRKALRLWMGLILILGLSCHFYSKTRRRLVHSRLLQTFCCLTIAVNLALYYFYYVYTASYFVKGTFRRQKFVEVLSNGSIRLQVFYIVVVPLWRFFGERKMCEAYDEVSRILDKELKHKSRSRFYCLTMLVKIHNFLHNFNFALSVLMVWGFRPLTVSDFLANLYFVYISLSMGAIQVAYVLLLLQLIEALRLNGRQVQSSYLLLMDQMHRQEHLRQIVRQVHRMFACMVATSLVYDLFLNTGTIYLGYTMVVQRQDALGIRAWTLKILLTALSFVVKLSDSLLLQVVCAHLLSVENKDCASPELHEQDAEATAVYRQWEMSVLRQAIRRASPEDKVLGLFRMDMRCAFALISSSLSYGTIIIQLGYVQS
ncbi:putative gustatory receptor 10b [Drosophila ficusphila]|uniref:putative gustatory receptor 10b n=1 Tax=Drosophila ficusphila TaxID=30025 RepID=UPI0007E7C428|nr:putative gustatory receptor 10b [Drosophila ficusphila]